MLASLSMLSHAMDVKSRPPIASAKTTRRWEKRNMEGSPAEVVEVKGVASIKDEIRLRHVILTIGHR